MLGYRVQGDGPPLLLIHGWGVSYSAWDLLAPLLARHFTLITVDLMGIGADTARPATATYYEAAADALEELRESLGLARWSVFSYSVGTRVGATYLRKYPQRVARAVYLCPIRTRSLWAAIQPPARWMRRVNRRPLTQLQTWLLSGWRLRLEVWIVAFNLARLPHLAIWTHDIARQPVETLKRLLLELPEGGRAPFPLVSEPPVPQLFVWARRDLISRAPSAVRPHDIILPLTHAAPVSAPYMVAAAILPFLLESSAASDDNAEAVPTELDNV